jgi:chemotaxis protein histidine kinase CheA
MASATSAVEFFILEASGYIDGLDSLLGSAGAHGPDRDALVRLTRALRGNSVMYRQPGITTVASALEGCARALREGRLGWTPQVQATLVATVDDLRLLVRSVRQWSAADDQRANARADELEGMVPRSPTPSTAVQAATEAGGRAYLATKTRELSVTVERVSAEPGDGAARAALARDVRALSGVALLREYPVLSIVVGALEREGAKLESGGGATEEARSRLRRAAKALGDSADALGAGDPASAERALREIARELEGAHGSEPSERIVSIEELFFADSGPTVVESSPSPPTSAAERFRIEIVGLAEHARRVIADVRRAPDDTERDRGWRALERAFRSLVDTARSFGETAVAGALGTWEGAVSRREADALESLDDAAAALADPGIPSASLQQRIAQRGGGIAPAEGPVAGATEAAPAAEPAGRAEERAPAPVEKPAPSVAPPSAAITPPPPAHEPEPLAEAFPPAEEEYQPPPRPSSRTPTGNELRDLLQSGISGLGGLEDQPLTPPVPLPQERVVPIETLVYSGSAALRRAREIRDEMRASGSTPDPETLDELFALLDLVNAE